MISYEKVSKIPNSHGRDVKLIIYKVIKRINYLLKFVKVIKDNSQYKMLMGHNEHIYLRYFVLPLYPDDKIVVYWKKFLFLNLFLSTVFYPFFISFINYGENVS